jgi:hypothetical protein
VARYVYGPIYPVADRTLMVSHRSGWALYWAEALDATLVTSRGEDELERVLKPSDTLYLYHGMEFQAFLDGRPLNLYGGWEIPMAGRFQRLLRFAEKLKKNLISLDFAMPRYGQMFQARAAYPSFNKQVWAGLDYVRMDKALGKGSSLLAPSGPHKEIVFGDSHALSWMRPGAKVIRHDGLTLYGALHHGLLLHLTEENALGAERLTLCLGNVDLRHHLARPGAMSVGALMMALKVQLKELLPHYKWIDLVRPLPMVNDERKIPQTGFHEGKPFYGTWEERAQLTYELIEGMANVALSFKGRKVRLPELPGSWSVTGSIDSCRPELNQAAMEKPGSVHIAPFQYRHAREGNLWTCLNPLFGGPK